MAVLLFCAMEHFKVLPSNAMVSLETHDCFHFVLFDIQSVMFPSKTEGVGFLFEKAEK